jgi:hypothetical protein
MLMLHADQSKQAQLTLYHDIDPRRQGYTKGEQQTEEVGRLLEQQRSQTEAIRSQGSLVTKLERERLRDWEMQCLYCTWSAAEYDSRGTSLYAEFICLVCTPELSL